MKNILLSSILLLLVAACDQPRAQDHTSKAKYEPSEFIRTFDAGELLSSGWTINSRSEEKRIYGGEAGSYRRGKIVFVSESNDSEPFSVGAIKTRLSTAPGFREMTSGNGSAYQFGYGNAAIYNGAIAASVVHSDNEVIVSYELMEKP